VLEGCATVCAAAGIVSTKPTPPNVCVVPVITTDMIVPMF
jgi:hypothetical protein